MKKRIAALLCMVLMLCCAQALAETCAHENSRYWTHSTQLNSGERWKANGDGATHSAYGKEWDDYYCYDCRTYFKKNHFEGLLTRDHAYSPSDGKCYDCRESCPHSRVDRREDQYELDAGAEWEPNDDGKTHSAQGKTYDTVVCYECMYKWEENVIYGPVTKKHNMYQGECYDCGYECAHEDSYKTSSTSTQLNSGEYWKPNADGKTHSAYGKYWEYYYCFDCSSQYEVLVTDGLLTRNHSYSSMTGRCYDCGYTCPHPNVQTYKDQYSLNSGESWAPNADGKTHSAEGKTYDSKWCPQCYHDWEENVVYKTLTEKHNMNDGVCYDCNFECAHENSEYDNGTSTELYDGEEWTANADGKTHSAYGKYWEWYTCLDCEEWYKVLKEDGLLTREHNFWGDGKCHDCGYECPHENTTYWSYNEYNLLDGERWVDDRNGMTHSGLCEVYDYFYCNDCRDGFRINKREEVVTEYHHGTNRCSSCNSTYLNDDRRTWWINEEPRSVTASVGESVKLTVKVFQRNDVNDKIERNTLTYRWYYRDAGESAFRKTSVTKATYTTTMTAEMSGRELYCEITDQYGYKEYSEIATISLPRFEITSQPQSRVASAGEKVTFTVKATGSGLKYQWYYRDAGATEWEKTSVTKASYTTTMKAERDGRQIYCEVTNDSGKSLKSQIVMLSLPELKITRQPTDASAYEGEKAKTSVKATGDGLKYAWYFKNVGESEFTKSTTTSSTYSLTMNEARNGRRVYCQVSDAYGRTVDTGEVTFSIRYKAKVVTQPQSVTAAEGENVSFSIEALGEGLKYQWYYRNAGAETWKKASSTEASYTTTMKADRHGRQVYCKVTDKHGNTAKSKTATMKLPPAEITQQPQDASAASGETVTFTVKATGKSLKYQWYYRNAGTTTWKKASSTSASYSTTMKTERDGREVYCKITDANGSVVKSNTAKMILKASENPDTPDEPQTPLAITSHPSNVTAAEGESVTFTVKATGDGLTYQWYYRNAGASSWTKGGSTSASYTTSITAARDGREVYCKVTDKYGNTADSNRAKMTLKASSKAAASFEITSQPSSVKASAGESATVKVKATGEGLKYQWYYRNEGSSSWKKASSTSRSYTFEVTEARDGRQIRCKITNADGKTLTSRTVTVTVK